MIAISSRDRPATLWISPEGEIHLANPSHEQFAENNINKFYPEFDFSDMECYPFDYFLRRGWIRRFNDSFVLDRLAIQTLKNYLIVQMPNEENLWIDIYDEKNLIKSLEHISSQDFIDSELYS